MKTFIVTGADLIRVLKSAPKVKNVPVTPAEFDAIQEAIDKCTPPNDALKDAYVRAKKKPASK